MVFPSKAYLQRQNSPELFAAFSPVALPPELPEGATVVEYHYAYNCALLGDPNFSIKLVLQYDSAEDYRLEQERLRLLAASTATVEEAPTGARYFFGATPEGLQMLTDERIEDGNATSLQFVLFEDKIQTVTYAIGHLYDGSQHGGDIVELGAAAMLPNYDTLYRED